MGVEVFLTAITLTVAIIGTLLRDPSRRVKAFLICLAALAGLGSVVKSINDESDKGFMRTALISSLSPSSSSYQKLCDDVDEGAKSRGFDEDLRYYHSADGMICFLSSTDKDKHGTLVFNRSEIAQMYANQIRRSNNKGVVDIAFKQSYVPKDMAEEFLDRVGLLGFNVFFSMFGRPASDYNYDDRFGVQIAFDDRIGKRQIVSFSPSELAEFKETKGPDLFYALEQGFRKKYASQIKQ